MFVNRRLDNSDPLAKISPEILQKIETVQTTIGVATSNNTADTIVKRDEAGGFSAGIITTSGLSDGSKLMLQATGNLTRLGVNGGPTMSGINNTAIGVNAMNANSSGGANCCIGSNAGSGITSGSENICIGNVAGHNNLTTGTRNVLIGTGSAVATSSQTNSIAIGYAAQAPASNTIQLGNGITNVYTSGVLNAAGLESFGSIPTVLNIASQNNTSTVNIGSGSAVQAINVGNSGAGKTTIQLGGGTDEVKVNLPLRDSAGATILSMQGTNNLLVGKNVMSALTTGSSNTFIGTGIANAATVSNYNIGIGDQALANMAGSDNQFGVGNIATGYRSLYQLTTGSNNVSVGNSSLYSLTTGANNIAIGEKAGYDQGNVNRCHVSGTGCTFLGNNTRPNAQNLSNAAAIGFEAIVDASNTIQLGNTSVTSVKTSGTITAATPTADTHLTTKLYVDNKVAAVSNQLLKTTDVVTFAGLILPNAGGSASTLNHYEEYDWVFQWKYGENPANMSSSVTVKIVKIGKVATFTTVNDPIWNSWGDVNIFEPSVLPPERFRPASTHASRVLVAVVSGGVSQVGVISTPHHTVSFTMRVLPSLSGGTFAPSGENSILPFHFSWVTKV